MNNTDIQTARNLGTEAFNAGLENGAPVLNPKVMDLLATISANFTDPWDSELSTKRHAIMKAYSHAFDTALVNAAIT